MLTHLGAPSELNTVSGKLETIERKLQTLEQRVNVAVGTGVQISNGQSEKDTAQRLRALETAWARTSQMLQSLTATNDRLANLATATNDRLANLARAVKEVRSTAAAPPVQAEMAELQAKSTMWAEQMASTSSWVEEMPTLRADVIDLKLQQQQLNNQMAELIQQRMQQERVHGQDEKPARPAKSTSQQELATESRPSDFTASDAVEFQDSVWDYTFLIGLPGTGLLCSVHIAVLVVVNAILQILLSIIINDIFTVSALDGDDVEDFRFWRLHYAHSYSLMNTFTQQPFLKDLCEFSSAAYMSTPAAGILDMIDSYAPQGGFHGKAPIIGPVLPIVIPDFADHFYIGVLLSLIAAFIWSLNVISNFQSMWDNAVAFYQIPRKELTTFVRGADNSHALVSVSRFRQVTYTLVFLLQFVVLVILGFAGLFYIIRTILVRDLLLNCSALAIVLDIDDYMAIFIPCNARQFLLKLDPLPRPDRPHFKGMTWSSLAKMLCVLVVMVLTYLELMSQVKVLDAVHHEICGGNRNFIAGIDSAGVVIASSPPPDSVIGWKDTYYSDAVYQLVQQKEAIQGGFSAGDGSSTATSILGGIWSLKGWIEAPAAEVLDYWNYECVDIIPVESSSYEYANHFLRLLREAHQNVSIHSCSDVVQHCGKDDVTGVRTRQICPITCGCADPGSSMIYIEATPGENGCPPVCRTTSTYNQSMWSRECKDSGLDSSYWSNYVKGLQVFMNSYGEDSWEDEIQSAMKDHGCGITSMDIQLWGYYWPDPCADWSELRLKAITYACPVTCGCETNHRPGCPETCRSKTANALQ